LIIFIKMRVLRREEMEINSVRRVHTVSSRDLFSGLKYTGGVWSSVSISNVGSRCTVKTKRPF